MAGRPGRAVTSYAVTSLRRRLGGAVSGWWGRLVDILVDMVGRWSAYPTTKLAE